MIDCWNTGPTQPPPPVYRNFYCTLLRLLQETQDEEELNIAPKKANWDLKRDVEKKLEKLNRRTQRAIVEIIRERMAEVHPISTTLCCLCDLLLHASCICKLFCCIISHHMVCMVRFLVRRCCIYEVVHNAFGG